MINSEMILKIFIIILSTILVSVTSNDYCALTCLSRTGQLLSNSACDCNFSPNCDEDTKRLRPDEKTKKHIVELHNQIREKVAAGSYENQPPASNMGALVYDDDLAHVAECFASKCIFGHDDCRRTEKFPFAGQNAFKAVNMKCDGDEIFSTTINLWFSEISSATENCIDYYTGCSGHYTQIIWAETTSVGCARVLSGQTCFVFCNYGPAGNILEQPVYIKGDPSCEPHKNYPHLCKGEQDEDSSATRLFLGMLLYVFLLLAYTYFGYFIW